MGFVLNHSRAGEAQALAKELGFPLYVKQLRAGLSFGISRVCAPDNLPAAFERAFAYDREYCLRTIFRCELSGNGRRRTLRRRGEQNRA